MLALLLLVIIIGFHNIKVTIDKNWIYLKFSSSFFFKKKIKNK